MVLELRRGVGMMLAKVAMGVALGAAPGCATEVAAEDEWEGEAVDESDLRAAQVHGGSTGAFLRQMTPAGYTRIESTITVPDYRTRGEPVPWVYFGLSDGATDVEVGLAFQEGTEDQVKPRRYLVYLRKHSDFYFGAESERIMPGETVRLAASLDRGVVSVERNGARMTLRGAGGRSIDGLAVALVPERTQVRRVVGLATKQFNYAGGALPSFGATTFVDTTLRSVSGERFAFEGARANWARRTSSGMRMGTIAWPLSGVRRAGVPGKREEVTLF